MSEAPYMQLYVGDYLGDTRHLTTEQHGAYLLLLMAMWSSDGTLPNDEAKLARMAGVSTARWRKIGGDVMEFFSVEDGGLTQKRLKKEREKWQEKSAKRREAGKRGGEAKALKDKNEHVANDIPNATNLPQQNATILHIPYSREDTSSNEDVGAREKNAAPKKANDLAEFKLELSEVDDEPLATFIKIRRSKRSPLTGYAARLFRRDAAACGLSVTEAVDTCISRNWLTVKPEYLEKRIARGQGPPNGKTLKTSWQRQKSAFEELDDEITDTASPERAIPSLPKPGAHG